MPIPSLRLRGVQPGDEDAIARLLSGDSELALQTASIPIPYTMEHAHEFLRAADPEQVFAILVGSGLVGIIGMSPNGSEAASIGYWIGREFWRRGYASHAVRLLIEEARLRGLSEFTADVFPDNVGSIEVLERNGFHWTAEIERNLQARGGLRRMIRFAKTF